MHYVSDIVSLRIIAICKWFNCLSKEIPMSDHTLSLLDEVKLQAKVLKPIVELLRTELGTDRGNALVHQALNEWSKSVYREIGEQAAGQPADKWQTLNADLMTRIGDDIDIDIVEISEEGMEINVTRCAYAEFFRELDEPELGSLLTCNIDHHIADVGGEQVSFSRQNTLMNGASYCDFKYMIKRSGE